MPLSFSPHTLQSTSSSSSSFSSSLLRPLPTSFLHLFLFFLLLLHPSPSSASLNVEQLCEIRCNIGRGGVLCKCNAFHFAGKRSEEQSSSSSSSFSSSSSSSSARYWVDDFIPSGPPYYYNNDDNDRKYRDGRKYANPLNDDNHRKYTNSPNNGDDDDLTLSPASFPVAQDRRKYTKNGREEKKRVNSPSEGDVTRLSAAMADKRKLVHDRKYTNPRRRNGDSTLSASLAGDRKYLNGRKYMNGQKFMNPRNGDDRTLPASLAVRDEEEEDRGRRGGRGGGLGWRMETKREGEGDGGRAGGMSREAEGRRRRVFPPLTSRTTRDLLESVLKTALSKRLIDRLRRRESHSQTSEGEEEEEWLGTAAHRSSFPFLALEDHHDRDHMK